MGILNELLSSVLFWAAWIIIPFIMEIVPSIGSIVILIRKHIHPDRIDKPAIDPEITLLIPVYNSEDTLEACLKSVNDSDYPNDRIRIFVVNNQGKDNSFDVFAKCQKDYPDLIMQWMNAKQGKSRALNLALFNSSGKYIINIDSDGFLEKSALKNMVYCFENHPEFDCMTGAILTDQDAIMKYRRGKSRLLRRLEYVEYAQAFLAGRSYASEANAVYTLSGAFSAFRKSSVLKSQLYNTDTICEDTQLTFQMRYLQNGRVGICESAIFFVDPIENMDKLYTQRQRWQRGSLEVSHMFLKDRARIRNMFTSPTVRTLVYDHTFAFPRLIWYLALICLLFMNYNPRLIIFSTLFLFGMYIVLNYFYYFSTLGYLSEFPEIHKFYQRQWTIIPLMPFFNLMVFFIRFMGIINSIGTASSWKTANLHEEKDKVKKIFDQDFARLHAVIERVDHFVNTEES